LPFPADLALLVIELHHSAIINAKTPCSRQA
jgi:hypothetical protein